MPAHHVSHRGSSFCDRYLHMARASESERYGQNETDLAWNLHADRSEVFYLLQYFLMTRLLFCDLCHYYYYYFIYLFFLKRSCFYYGSVRKYRASFVDYLRNRSALAVNCWVIIHCLEVSCKVDQITSAKRKWFIYLQLTDSDLLLNNSRTRADLFRF